MAEIVNRYRVWCDTDSKWEYIWMEGPNVPTTCPINNAHTIDATKTSIVDSIETVTQDVIIQEEFVKTGGHYQTRQVHLSCLPNSWSTIDVTWEYPITILNAEVHNTEEMRGDLVEVIVAPDTIVGAITNFISVSDTVINVQQSVIDNVDIGYRINITDFVGLNDLGWVIGKDPENLTLTMQLPATTAFSPLSPTYVRMSPYMVRDYTMGHAGRYTLGEGKIGGSYIPAGTPIRIRYFNQHPTDVKNYYVEMEYLY